MVSLRKDWAQLHFDDVHFAPVHFGQTRKHWFMLSDARQWRVEPLRDPEAEVGAGAGAGAGAEAEVEAAAGAGAEAEVEAEQLLPTEEGCPLFHGLSLGDFDETHPTPDAPLTSANVREAVIAGCRSRLLESRRAALAALREGALPTAHP